MVGAKLKLLSPVGESARCRKITYSRTYPQFLIQLSTKGVLGRLAGICLAPGKFPALTQITTGRSPDKEKGAVA